MQILVHVEGGIVQSVSSDEPLDADVVVIDYDTDGIEPKEIHEVPQSDEPNDTEKACICFHGKVGTINHCIFDYLNKISL